MSASSLRILTLYACSIAGSDQGDRRVAHGFAADVLAVPRHVASGVCVNAFGLGGMIPNRPRSAEFGSLAHSGAIRIRSGIVPRLRLERAAKRSPKSKSHRIDERYAHAAPGRRSAEAYPPLSRPVNARNPANPPAAEGISPGRCGVARPAPRRVPDSANPVGQLDRRNGEPGRALARPTASNGIRHPHDPPTEPCLDLCRVGPSHTRVRTSPGTRDRRSSRPRACYSADRNGVMTSTPSAVVFRAHPDSERTFVHHS